MIGHMHGLVFEISISYWQDQPGMGTAQQHQEAHTTPGSTDASTGIKQQARPAPTSHASRDAKESPLHSIKQPRTASA